MIQLYQNRNMEENTEIVESLLENTTEYAVKSYELVKLKVIDKTSDWVSSFIPHFVVIVVIGSFLFFVNLGVAFWLSELLGKIFYGFFAVAAFYAVIAFIIHFFMRKWLKRIFYDYIIRQIFK